MKKHLLSLFAMASMVFASSCSQEEVISQSTGNEVKVTFTTELRNDVKSRGVGDDTDNVDQLIFAVYDEMGKEISLLRQSTHPDADGATKQIKLTPVGEKQKATIDVVLVKGQTYKFAFWAQKKGFSAYTFNPETAEVTVNYLDRKANQREADAFFAGIPSHTVTGTFTMDVTLKRPFAQVNFLTSQKDIENARKAGFNPANSRIIVENVAQTLKVLTGEVSNFNNAEVTFDYAALLKNESNKIEETTINSVSGNWKYLATAYFLPQNKSEETKINATMEIQAEDANKAVTKIVASDITAQRNYRTNIYGNLLTSNGTFNVLVDPSFDGDHNVASGVYDVTGTSLSALLDTNKTLEGDVVYNVSGLSAEDNISVEIPADTEASSLTFNFTDIKDNATMSIADASGSNYNGTVILKNPADKTISELTIALPKAHVNLAQGKYSNIIASTSSSTLVISGGVVVEELTVNSGNVEIENGGSVETIGKGDTNTDPITFVYLEEGVEQPTINEEDSNIILSKEEESTGIYTIDLTEDLNLGSNILYLDKNTVINGNGFKLISSANRVVRITEPGVYIEMNQVNVVSTAVREGDKDIRGISIDNINDVTLELNECSVDFTHPSASDWAYGVNQVPPSNGNTITINGGTYEGANVINIWGQNHTVTVDGATLTSLYQANEMYTGVCVKLSANNDYVSTGNKLTVKNTTFNGNHAVAIENNGGDKNTVVTENNTDKTVIQIAKVGNSYYSDLEEADKIANASNPIILLWSAELKKDITLNNILQIERPVGVNRPLTLDGKGFKLTSKAGRAINVNTERDVHIKNLKIDASGERAINVIQKPVNLSIDNVTAEAENYTVNVATSAGAANIAIENSTLIGLNTVNVNGAGAEVTIDGSTVNCDDNNTTEGESYAALVLGKDATNASIVVTNTTINVKEGSDSYKAKNSAVGGEITIDGKTDDVQITVAIITFEGSDYYYGFSTIQSAVDFAEEKKIENIQIIRPIEIDEEVTIDLKGKTVTAASTSAFVANAGAKLTLKNGKVMAYESTVRAVGGKVVIESGEYTSTGTALDSPATYRYSLDCREGGELIINGGTFKSNNGMINVGSTVIINGGKFENIVEKTMTRHFAYVSGNLTINDGEFYGKANSSAGGCFFCGAAAGGEITVNGGKFTSLWTSGSVNRIFEAYASGSTINVTGGMFNTNGGIKSLVTENTDEATKEAYPYVAK